MAQENFKKHLGEDGFKQLISLIKTGFADLLHKHTIADITDYKVDNSLNTNSTNPVQNQVVKEALDLKVPTARTVNGKSLDADITLNASDVGTMTSEEITSELDEKANAIEVAYIDIEDNENIEYEDVRPHVELVDNLNSTSTTSALTANQGRILNAKKADRTDIELLTEETQRLQSLINILDSKIESTSKTEVTLDNEMLTFEGQSIIYNDTEQMIIFN